MSFANGDESSTPGGVAFSYYLMGFCFLGLLGAVASVLIYKCLTPAKTIKEHRDTLSGFLPPIVEGGVEHIQADQIPFPFLSTLSASGDPLLASVVPVRAQSYDFGEGKSAHDRYILRYRRKDQIEKIGSGKMPTIFYYPGTGFLSREQFSDQFCRALALALPEYQIFILNGRLAPEYKFPAMHDDASLMLESLLAEKERFGIDQDRIYFMGYSSGGNFAMNAALVHKAVKLIMISPFINFNKNWRELWEAGRDKSIPQGFIEQIIEAYAGSCKDKMNPVLSPLYSSLEALGRLPPTKIIVGVGDYVFPDCLRLDKRLKEAGVIPASSRETALVRMDVGDQNIGHGTLWLNFKDLVEHVLGMLVAPTITPSRRLGAGSTMDHIGGAPPRLTTASSTPFQVTTEKYAATVRVEEGSGAVADKGEGLYHRHRTGDSPASSGVPGYS